MNKHFQIPISIVIPTLGEPHILHCLKKINESTHIPSEVIICLPKKNLLNIKKIISSFKKIKIKILMSKKKNQVFQRILGFKKAKYKIIMQLDDDVLIEKDCLFNMYKFINNKNNIAVSPKYIDIERVSSLYRKPKSLILKIYHWLINSKKGYAPGTVALCGYNYGDEIYYKKFKFHEWLSGGAIMHHKKNLILKNFYPFKFKRSVCEDILHSFILRKNKVKLVKLYNAKVCAKESTRITTEKSFILVLNNFFDEFLIRRYIVKKYNLSVLRLYIYYLIYFLRLLLIQIK